MCVRKVGWKRTSPASVALVVVRWREAGLIFVIGGAVPVTGVVPGRPALLSAPSLLLTTTWKPRTTTVSPYVTF